MPDAVIQRRPPFPLRPWVRGKAYDDLARPSVLHCDAFVVSAREATYLEIWWVEGGSRVMAHDVYVIEPDGLTPAWQLPASVMRVYWTWQNHAWMRRLHKTVLAQGDRMLGIGRGRWARVVTQAHYVHVTDRDCEPTPNAYTPPKPYVPRAGATSGELAAAFAVREPKRRGRPPKVREEDDVRVVPKPRALPDIL